MTNEMTRSERVTALEANGLSPIRTRKALELMSDKELANLEVHVANLESADPYAAATKNAPRAAQPSDDPNYQPHGTPPDGYKIALGRKKAR